MDYKVLKALLKLKADEVEVTTFVQYVEQLVNEKDKKTGQPKNWWAAKITEKQYAHLFLKVKEAGCTLDGEDVTLQYKGKVLISYNYKAYKNRVLRSYPESMFDVQVVRQKDVFEISKATSVISYKHEFGSPFESEKENPIIGAYCLIRNNRGEFVELMGLEEINKIRSTAKTQQIWTEWFSEMAKKSVIKRACKFHFSDLVAEMEKQDNENYDLDKPAFSEIIKKEIEEAETNEKLTEIYLKYDKTVEDREAFLFHLNERKVEILEAAQ